MLKQVERMLQHNETGQFQLEKFGKKKKLSKRTEHKTFQI